MRQIAANAGAEGAMVLQHVRGESGNPGFDANSGEYVDMVDHGHHRSDQGGPDCLAERRQRGGIAAHH